MKNKILFLLLTNAIILFDSCKNEKSNEQSMQIETLQKEVTQLKQRDSLILKQIDSLRTNFVNQKKNRSYTKTNTIYNWQCTLCGRIVQQAEKPGWMTTGNHGCQHHWYRL